MDLTDLDRANELLTSRMDGMADLNPELQRMLPKVNKGTMDAATLSETMRLLDEYESRLLQAGTRKWFIEGSTFSIDHCPKHKMFFDAGKDYHERSFMAANRSGKSVAGAYEVSCHGTGLYPFWWNGKVFDRPTHGWAIGSTARSTRDVVQKELLGAIGSPGTGMIPAHLMGRSWSLAGVPQGIDVIEVKHVSGGWSTIGFKNYEQDVQAFYGTAKDWIWADEEIPALIYNECLLRTMTTGGIMLNTFTPLHGLTPFVVNFCQKADFLGSKRPFIADAGKDVDEGEDSRIALLNTSKAVVTAGWDDAPWLDEESKRRMLADTPPHLRDARSKGTPAMGSGNIYPIPLEEIQCSPFKIPDHWKRMYALDVGWNVTAALWAAVDPDTDTVYIYDEHYVREQPPAVHAMSILTRGKWIPGVIDPASRGKSQTDGLQMIVLYKENGLNLKPANNAVDAGITDTWNRLAAGKLKVFSTLQNFPKEYMLYRRDLKGKVIKEDDHLMDALRYIINNLQRAISKSQLTSSGVYNGTRRYDL